MADLKKEFEEFRARTEKAFDSKDSNEMFAILGELGEDSKKHVDEVVKELGETTGTKRDLMASIARVALVKDFIPMRDFVEEQLITGNQAKVDEVAVKTYEILNDIIMYALTKIR